MTAHRAFAKCSGVQLKMTVAADVVDRAAAVEREKSMAEAARAAEVRTEEERRLKAAAQAAAAQAELVRCKSGAGCSRIL